MHHRAACHAVSLFVLAATLAAPGAARAAEAAPEAPEATRPSSSLGLGLTLHRFQDDFGFGVLATSPMFGRLYRVTLGGGAAFAPHVPSGDREEWIAYGHARAALEIGAHLEGTPIRLYGFSGPELVFTPSRLREGVVGIGAIGGFGFEVYFDRDGREKNQGFFVELGAVGTGLRAENVPGKPSFHNGFVATVGWKIFP